MMLSMVWRYVVKRGWVPARWRRWRASACKINGRRRSDTPSSGLEMMIIWPAHQIVNILTELVIVYG